MKNDSDSEMVAMVRNFHVRVGYEYESAPSVKDAGRRALWEKLISEEHAELLNALKSEDIYKVADGIADCIYVLIGAALAFSIPVDDVFKEVHSSNMSKIDSKVHWRADGKVLRGKDYREPDIKKVIDRSTAKSE